jgi:hypothetical protein
VLHSMLSSPRLTPVVSPVWENSHLIMRKFPPLMVVVLAAIPSFPVAAEKAPPLPATIGYTFFLDGKRVGRTDIRVSQTRDALRFESKLRVDKGPASIELSTRTEADPSTYALRTFSFNGTKAGAETSAHVTVVGDSAYGTIATEGGPKPRGRRVRAGPMVIWEDWVMELEILLARQQAREFQNPKTRDLVLAASFGAGSVTLGYSGEAIVESGSRSLVARKLMVAIQGGEPFESLIHPELGIPVYIRFPGVRAEIFLDQFFGDNPVSLYATRSGSQGSR